MAFTFSAGEDESTESEDSDDNSEQVVYSCDQCTYCSTEKHFCSDMSCPMCQTGKAKPLNG